MNLLSKFTAKKQETTKDTTPVAVEEIENLIEMIELANKINATFDLCLILRMGGFTVNSAIFKGIKMLKKSKNESDRIVISYYNNLLSTETTIDAEDIVHVSLEVLFTDTKEGGV